MAKKFAAKHDVADKGYAQKTRSTQKPAHEKLTDTRPQTLSGYAGTMGQSPMPTTAPPERIGEGPVPGSPMPSDLTLPPTPNINP